MKHLVPLLSTLSLALASPAIAQQPAPPAAPAPRMSMMGPRAGMGPGANPAQRLLALRAQLSLTDAQVARLQQLATAQRQALVPPMPAMLRARADLLDAMQKRDLNAAHAAMDRMARLRTDAAFARLKAASDARDVLTAEQQAGLEQFQAARRGRMGAFPGQRRGGPGAGRGMGLMRGMHGGMPGMGMGMGPGMGPGMGRGMGPGMGGMGPGMGPDSL